MVSNEKVLVLKQNLNPLTKIITTGRRVQYELKNDSVIHHGQLQKIQNDSLVINNDVVFIANLKMIQIMWKLLGIIPFLNSAKTYNLEKTGEPALATGKETCFLKAKPIAANNFQSVLSGYK